MKLSLDKKMILSMVGVLIVILSLLMVKYTKNPFVPGQEPYYDMKIVKTFVGTVEPGISKEPVDAYHGMIIFLAQWIPIPTGIILLAILSNLGIVIMLYILFSKWLSEKKEGFFAILVLIISPTFIYTTLVPERVSFYALLMLVVFVMVTSRQLLLVAGAQVLSLLVVTANMYIFMAFMILLFSLFLWHQKKQILVVGIICALLGFLYQRWIVIKYGSFHPSFFYPENIFPRFISNLGALLGFDIFFIFLGIVGLVLLWRQKKKNIPFFFGLLPLCLLTLFDPELVVILNLMVAFLVALTIVKIMERKWRIQLIKRLTLLVIIVGFIISLVVFSVRLLSLGPSMEIVSAASFLGDQEKGVVLSHEDYGLWIEFYADQPAVLDDGPYYKKDYPSLVNQSYELFYSHNLKYTKSLLDEMNISYIFVSDEMKSSLIWNEPEEGLLFLFRNNETFKSIYKNEAVEIWKVLHEIEQRNESARDQ